MSQDGKGFIDSGEIRLCLLDDAAQLLEDGSISVDHATNLRLEWNAPEALPPRDAFAFERRLERAGELRRVLRDRQRIVRIRAGDCAQKERDVRDRSRQRP